MAEPVRAAGVQIASPRSDALNTTGTVLARVRTRGPVARMQIYLRGKRFGDVSPRFERRPGGVRTARLRLGRELVRGQNHLFVRVRRPSGKTETEAVSFTTARRRPGLLSFSRIPRGVTHVPILVRARAPSADDLRVRLNGRDVRPAFEDDRDGRCHARLAAHHGLRFGRNRLVATALNRRGDYQRAVRVFRIRRTRPLVGAGRDRTITSGSRLRLDGRSTRATSSRSGLRLRWRIVSRPRGSTARLGRPIGTRPRFRPDVNGHYRIRLRASESTGGRARAAAAVATDSVTVAAQPDVLPAGVQVTTLASSTTPGIDFWGDFYALGDGWVQALVVDRETLDFVSNTPYPGTDAGAAALASDMSNLGPSELVILSGGGGPASMSSKGSASLVQAVTGLGAVLQPGTGSIAQLLTGQWSLVGIQGLPQGTAYQLIGLQQQPGSPVGSMSGFLQQDVSGNYTFTWPPSFQTFDTYATPSSGYQSAVSVGSQTYTSSTVPQDQGGLHVVWLDPGTLELRGEYTAVASENQCPSPGLQCLSGLAGTLESIVNSGSPALVFVSTINEPVMNRSTDGRSWARVAQTLNSMGANPFVLLGLNGSGDYTLVGLQGLLQLEGPNAGAELSSIVTGSGPRQTGLLERNRQGNWEVGTSGSPTAQVDPTAFQPSLQRILAQENQAFPPFEDRAEQAAEVYIAQQLCTELDVFCAGLDPVFGIRAYYWAGENIDWNGAKSTLDTMPACNTPPCPGAFKQVQQTLSDEFDKVETVTGYFNKGGGSGSLYGLLDNIFIDNSVGFTGIAFDILQLYNPPPVEPQGDNVGDIIDDALTIGSGAAGPVPEVGGAVSGALTVAAGVNALVGTLSSNEDGVPNFNPSSFEGNIITWGKQLEQAWDNSIAALGNTADLLVSDAGRLNAAATLINTDGVDGGWNADPSSITEVTNSLNRSMEAYLWWTMLPSTVQVAVCPREPKAPRGWTQVSAPDVFHPYWVQQAPPFQPPGDIVNDVWLFLVGPNYRVPGEGTLAPLFAGDGVAMQQPYFFAEAWKTGKRPTSPGFTYVEGAGWLEGFYDCAP